MSPAKPPGWQRTEAGWTDVPCTAVITVAFSGDAGVAVDGVTCQKTVPTRNGIAHRHGDHWWAGKMAGVKASIAWKDKP